MELKAAWGSGWAHQKHRENWRFPSNSQGWQCWTIGLGEIVNYPAIPLSQVEFLVTYGR